MMQNLINCLKNIPSHSRSKATYHSLSENQGLSCIQLKNFLGSVRQTFEKKFDHQKLQNLCLDSEALFHGSMEAGKLYPDIFQISLNLAQANVCRVSHHQA